MSGNNNLLKEISAFANSGDGIEVLGAINQLLKNDAGDSSKGNGGDGIRVAGPGNDLQENKASSNGLAAGNLAADGFDISGGVSGTGGPNKLKKNVSNSGFREQLDAGEQGRRVPAAQLRDEQRRREQGRQRERPRLGEVQHGVPVCDVELHVAERLRIGGRSTV